jgi:GMP synthase (glutamine-hydrolysing)
MILIISTCQEKLHEFEFVKPIEKIIGDCFVKKYDEFSENDLKKADKVIISGTSLKDNYILDNLNKFEWLKKFDKPVFGICAGHHIIQLLFGAELNEIKEIGSIEVDFEREYLGLINKQKVYALHGKSSFSSDFEIYGKSEKCVHAVKHKKKEIYSTLFHPEVYNQEILKKFCGL